MLGLSALYGLPRRGVRYLTNGQNSVTLPNGTDKADPIRPPPGGLVPGRSGYYDFHHTGRVMRFRDGSVTLTACEFPIFAEPGYTQADYEDKPPRAKPSGANIERAIKRARAEMRNLLRNNPLPWFVTLTFDQQKINRYDAREIVRRVGYWCDNNVRRKGLAYALVPEYHKDGAIHFHGFFNDALTMIDSGHSQGGRAVYNCPEWSFGFSACERVDDNAKALAYSLKYVGKGSEKIGGRWWYHGGALEKPIVEYVDLDPGLVESLGGVIVHLDRIDTDLVIVDLTAEEYDFLKGWIGAWNVTNETKLN